MRRENAGALALFVQVHWEIEMKIHNSRCVEPLNPFLD
jgi:hypothetical protein